MKLIDANAIRYIWANGTICVEPSTIKKMPTVNPWEIVYDELTKNEMLCGKYDARTSDAKHFINGVWMVMEVIAERAECHDEFDEMFMQNLKDSEDRAERRMLKRAYEKAEE